MNTLEFDIRDAIDEDIPFIYATWLESYRYDSYFGKSHRNTIFFNDYKKVLDKILLESHVSVACVKEAPDTILGYMVHEPGVLHYVFVKGPFRRLKIATGLFNYAFDNPYITYTHKTYTVVPIIQRMDTLTYRGTSLLNKGEIHGKSQRTTDT